MIFSLKAVGTPPPDMPYKLIEVHYISVNHVIKTDTVFIINHDCICVVDRKKTFTYSYEEMMEEIEKGAFEIV